MISYDDLISIRQKLKDAKWHRNAFNCSKCPESGCPAWMDLNWTYTNSDSKDQRVEKAEGCSFAWMPVLMADVITSSHHVRSAQDGHFKETNMIIKQAALATVKYIKGVAPLLVAKQVEQIGE